MQAAKIRWHGDLKLHPGRSRTKGPAAPSPSSDAVQPQSGPARLSNRQAAGVILNSGAKKWGTSSFNDIWTVISVPVVQVPFANGSCAADGWYYAMSLAGIDGYVWYGGSTGNLSLFEPVEFTGVLEGINCFGGPPFYEAVVGLWDADYGFNGVFSLNPGDLFYTEIHAFGGCNSGSAFVEDLTTLTYNSYSIGNPCLLKQTGTYANWIVARPDFASGGAPDDLSPLGNTIGIFFDGGAVVNGKGQRFYPGSQAASTEILTMTDDASDQSIEIVNQGNTGSQGLSALWFQDTGCAFAGGCTP